MTAGQRIAVIGSGIAGLTTAHLLSKEHEVTVFEANDYIGGHTHTVPVTLEEQSNIKQYNVDTGFIVCNDRNYPNFLNFMEKLGVAIQPTEMSFSVKNPTLNLEYNGHNLNTLFAQRSNLFKPRFLSFVREILRFNKAAKSRLNQQDSHTITLNEFLNEQNFGSMLKENYLLPMVSAIWSCSVKQAGEFPLTFFLQFFQNHGLLDVSNRPQWFVLKGGSHSYIEPMIRPFKDRLTLNSPVEQIRRTGQGVELYSKASNQLFDQVVLACHSDQALTMLQQPTATEQDILSAIQYQENDVTLHIDTDLMPERKAAWASWNFLAGTQQSDQLPVVTYSMNILQGIGSIHDEKPLLVSLNANELIDPAKVIQRFRYAHPVYSLESSSAQLRRSEICGTDRIHYCGAYWYNGFHEDGVRSALDVCARFGVKL